VLHVRQNYLLINTGQYFNKEFIANLLKIWQIFKYLEKIVTNQTYVQDESKVGLQPRFKPGSSHVGFVVEKVTLGQVSPST
jgi:hypothetical protein